MKYFDASPTSSGASSPNPYIHTPTVSFTSTTGGDNDGEEYEHHDIDIGSGCWAYEGVVLPGGMVMLGRWWSPMDEGDARTCTGPFLFWNVEEVGTGGEGPDLSEVAC